MPKIIRPFQLSCNTRVLEHSRQFFLTISASLGFRLTTGEILFEQDYLFDALSCMGEMPMPDPLMPKPQAEYLVSGRFFSPGKKPVPIGNVKVKIGTQEKSLYVFGPRTWGVIGASKPEPITEMPIDWEHAFGGPDFEVNTKGTGYKTDTLPCVENPQHLITGKGQTPVPAGFAPVDVMSPLRARYRGNYDRYMDKFFPGYPDSTDWRFFMTAPEDQWINGFYSGDETFSILHMHPDLPLIEGHLPNLIARCFYYQNVIKNPEKTVTSEFYEKKLNLDTVWLFPEKLVGLMIWRGVIPVGDDEGSEISAILGAYESRSDPARSQAYYQQALDLRLNSKDVLLNHFKTLDLIPVGAICAIDLLVSDALSAPKSELDLNLEQKIAEVKKTVEEYKNISISNLEDLKDKTGDTPEIRQKFDEAIAALQNKNKPQSTPEIDQLMKEIDTLFPGLLSGKLDMKTFSFEKLDEMMKIINRFTEKQREEIDQQIENTKEQVTKELETVKADPNVTPEMVAKLESGLAMLSNPEPPMQPVLRFSAQTVNEPLAQVAEGLKQQMETMKKEVSLSNPNNELLMKLIADQAILFEEADKRLKTAETAFKSGYPTYAHFLDEGLPPHQEPLPTITAAFLARFRQKQSLVDRDYACIDLKGKNLDGIDLSGTLLEQVNLAGASLKGANLSGAVLARANLIETDFTGANLERANIGAVDGTRANFSHTNLKETVLARGNFAEADFSHAVFDKTDMFEASFPRARFCHASLPEIIFLKTDFQNAIFSQIKMLRVGFVQCQLNRADFAGAEGLSCLFVNSDLDRCCFNHSNLTGSCFIGDEIHFNENRFQYACLNKVNFLGMPLAGTDFSYAHLENALLNDADLTGANLQHAQAKNAQFRKANLKKARLDFINLLEGSLAKANLTDSSLIKANLAYVDFLRSTIHHTDFRDANLDRTLIQDWRPA
jgi:uncharacterized protein YjbI with pentapeptide repeats/gas vesicle protein